MRFKRSHNTHLSKSIHIFWDITISLMSLPIGIKFVLDIIRFGLIFICEICECFSFLYEVWLSMIVIYVSNTKFWLALVKS